MKGGRDKPTHIPMSLRRCTWTFAFRLRLLLFQVSRRLPPGTCHCSLPEQCDPVRSAVSAVVQLMSQSLAEDQGGTGCCGSSYLSRLAQPAAGERWGRAGTRFNKECKYRLLLPLQGAARQSGQGHTLCTTKCPASSPSQLK